MKALIQFFLDNNVVVHAVGVLLLIFAAVYISAIKAGDAGVFLRRGGELVRQRAPMVIERYAALKKALAADGLSATEKITAAELKGAKNVAKLAETDPALAKVFDDAAPGIDLIEAGAYLSTSAWTTLESAIVPAEPRPSSTRLMPPMSMPGLRRLP